MASIPRQSAEAGAAIIQPSPASRLPSETGFGMQGGSKAVFVRLSFMTLLEFVVFGAWFATLGLVLQAHGMASVIGTAYLLSALAAMVSPLFLGAIGDRYFQSQKVLSIAHLFGGLALLAMSDRIAHGQSRAFLMLVFCYMLLFMPTLGLINHISLRHLGSQKAKFAYIRVCAPVGWVLAGFGVGQLGLSASPHIFTVAAIVSFMLGLYALTLPATPPPAKGERFSFGDLVGAKAFVLFRDKNFTVLIVCSLLTAVSLSFYNTFSSSYLAALGISNVAGVLAIGQASEIGFIALIPLVLSRFSMKWTLLVGIAMWGVRFLLFVAAAHGIQGLAVLSVALHGICNDFCMVIAVMYIDRLAPPQLAAQAQGWVILVFSGVGAAIGAVASGSIFAGTVLPHQAIGARAWDPLWTVPVGVVALNMLLWIFLFRDDGKPGAVLESGRTA